MNTQTEIEKVVETLIAEFNECPASKHISAVLTTDHIRTGKKDWVGETTTDVLRRLLPVALTEAEERGARGRVNNIVEYLMKYPEATIADYYADHLRELTD